MRTLFSSRAALLLLISVFFIISDVFAYDDNTERRVSIGLRLFRTLLASDNKLQNKIDQQNHLNLLLIASNNSSVAQFYADQLLNLGRSSKKGKIHDFPIKISIAKATQLDDTQNIPVAGIYIIDKLSKSELEAVINYGISQQIIVYSPFEGDVQNGVLAGIAIGIRVRPFINKQTLDQSQLVIKSLFLKVAKIYED